MSKEDKIIVHSQLKALQKKDWKTLSLDEKKASYYIAFGPYGPRAPVSQPGEGMKIFLSVLGLVSIAGAVSLAIQSFAPPPPKTLTKEWQEASNERAIEQKMNPITGISSEGYKGKGFVTHK
jgi:cytochrome c oxidase subunit 4